MNSETSSMKIGKLLVAYGAVDLVTGGMLLTEAMPVHRPVIGSQQAFHCTQYRYCRYPTYIAPVYCNFIWFFLQQT